MFEDLFSPAKLLVILVVALFLFGPQRLPEIGRSIGRAIRELQSSMSSVRDALTPDEDGKDTQAHRD